ncbi:hypothetical protein [Streptomyces sp. CBMA156]|uniref:hypothetical protein n=1 Tax=Streptomyces sp. CBMA156 TaxID=1930280 RepID=UPI00166199C1|nr:hypothetical protein [Streptomyces sp. CBMA156]MBD0675476.1 hypothetical protein [Streptomyces sp. CBMA156]
MVWADRLVRWHRDRRPGEWAHAGLGPDPAGTVGQAALLVAAALLDTATASGLDEPADGSALLDIPLSAVAALLTGADDEVIGALLDRTRPQLAATAQGLDVLRALWSITADVEDLHQRRRAQRLARTVLAGHQAASMRTGTDPAARLLLRDRMDDLAPWEEARRARAWAAEVTAQAGPGDDR